MKNTIFASDVSECVCVCVRVCECVSVWAMCMCASMSACESERFGTYIICVFLCRC